MANAHLGDSLLVYRGDSLKTVPKLIRRAIALAAALTFSAACARAPSDSRTTVRLLGSPDTGGFSKGLFAEFEKANPDLRVELVEGPAATNAREDLYTTAFLAGEDTYDVVLMDVVWLPKFAAQGWLKPLDELFPPSEQSAFLPGDMEGSRFMGRVYRVPLQADGGLLYYRADLLKARGLRPPETFPELARVAEALQDPPRLWGYVFQGKQYEGLVCNFLETLWGHGGELLDESGRVRLDEPVGERALSFLVDAVRGRRIAPEGVLTYQEEESRHLFQQGRAVFMRNWPYAFALLQAEDSPVRGKVGILPLPHEAGNPGAGTLGGWGLGISSFSKHPEAAWRLIRFLSSAESQKRAFLKTGALPSRESLYRDRELARSNPHLPLLHETLRRARPRPAHPAYARISDILQLRLSAALSGQQAPKAALAAAAAELRAHLRP